MELNAAQQALLNKYNVVRCDDAEYGLDSEIAVFMLNVLESLDEAPNNNHSHLRTSGTFLIQDAQSGNLALTIDVNTPDYEDSLVIHTSVAVGIDIAKKSITSIDLSTATLDLSHKCNANELEDEIETYLDTEFEITDGGKAIADVIFSDGQWRNGLENFIFL